MIYVPPLGSRQSKTTSPSRQSAVFVGEGLAKPSRLLPVYARRAAESEVELVLVGFFQCSGAVLVVDQVADFNCHLEIFGVVLD